MLLSGGAYRGKRAAALSGVPLSTVHWWARERILVPSISARKLKLWSYADLIGLRLIYWLRRKKTSEAGVDIPATSMPMVKRALNSLRELNVPLWDADGPAILVDEEGRVVLDTPTGRLNVDGQPTQDGFLNLVAPFSTAEGTQGPDLARPRPELRIAPARLSGSPHIAGTRIETCAIASLLGEGHSAQWVAELYPVLTPAQIAQSFELEAQLDNNLRLSAAA
ncbi:MAG: DUF433 domain-containing protein [Mycobacteriales bacterium]